MMTVGVFTKIQVMQNSLETGIEEDHGAISHNRAAGHIINGTDPRVRWHLKKKKTSAVMSS